MAAEFVSDTHGRFYELAETTTSMGERDDLSASLPKDVLTAILNTLPVELSFVDADDTVRYFSHEEHQRVFARMRGSIDLKAQECHPPHSLYKVNDPRRISEWPAERHTVLDRPRWMQDPLPLLARS